ncbi:MAG: hypothetical protein UT92_C0007G0003 [Candidatus Curtissbacteria bacterium GW2011_GWA1_40_24]|uniref:Glycosyltransferase RgtA/B/C/D-like domain-containing protein n=1 Tax=Candidatus Curtissbacteria bacterium GW2011_GWA1_40_24 TaxID=1618406 RepID=A0A0G0RRR6_9BACT|nr:MAG: hypothetical protein UT92_C0007G0003 [Candidatus Curtissbacteria bacterium GW2011_GWA1_40_24]
MIIIALLLVHLIFLINTRFVLWPEMVVYPYLLNNNFLLYQDVINPYSPILTWFLAIFAKIFGYLPPPYQILTWVIILIIDLSIYIISQKMFKNKLFALSSVAFFAVLSIPFGINGLWFDLVQTPFILWALYFFYKFLNARNKSVLKNNFFISFLLLTIAFFIKQQVFWVGLLFFMFALSKYRFDVLKFLKNHYQASLPFGVLFIFHVFYFFVQGTLANFAFWVFYFPAFLASKMPGYILLPSAKQMLIVFALFVFFVPTMVRKSQILFLATPAVLILFAYPRFDYFHLIPALAAIAIFFGPNFEHFKKSNATIKGVFLLTLIFLSLFTFRYIQNQWHKETRFFEREIYQTAKVVELLTDKNERIYVQNGPDQIFPLANRLPPKPWADDFSWYLEVPNLQKKVVDNLEKDKPRYIIFQPYLKGEKYGLGSYRPDDIADYIDNNYVNFAQIDHDLYLKAKK